MRKEIGVILATGILSLMIVATVLLFAADTDTRNSTTTGTGASPRSSSRTSVIGTSSSTVSATTVGRRDVLLNRGFESGHLAPWWLPSGNRTVLMSTNDPHSGNYSLELVTKQGAVNGNGTVVIQNINPNNSGNGECILGGAQVTRFGAAVRPNLNLSLWYRTPNATTDRIRVDVVFLNGSANGKIFVAYALDWKGPLPNSTGRGDVYVLTSNPSSGSGGSWTQVRFNLYADFIKYFGFDPIANHYCVNYISLYQENPNTYTRASNVYSYFDDIELDERTWP